LTFDEERQLAAALAQPLGWWHRLPNTWLILDEESQQSCDSLRGIVQGINPAAQCIVVEFQVSNWAARLQHPEDAWLSIWTRPPARQ
jgi:hypothetical protein